MANSVYEEKLNRIRKAVALEPVDRIPVAPGANAYWARSQGIKLKDYISDFELSREANIKALTELDADATQNEIFSPYLLCGHWLSEVWVPGKELPDDEMWQVIEKQTIRQDEYHDILENGFEQFYKRVNRERCGDPDTQLIPYFAACGEAKRRFIEAGLPCICDFLMITPFEFFCGGRSLELFFMEDLMDEPDLVDKVFASAMEYTLKTYEEMLARMRPIGVWVGGWRTAPAMLSPEQWERFVWPYMKEYANLCFKYDTIPLFHLDSCWDRELARFREMPAKRCIMGLDSTTDIRKAHQAVGDMMCLLGDVPAELLAFGRPQDVESYVRGILDDNGPIGYIVSSGCDIPSDAKKENVAAMVSSAHNYLKTGK